MTVESATSGQVAPAAAVDPAIEREMVAIDRSCQTPVTFLLLSAVTWLAFGTLVTLLNSIQLHAPGFLADVSWLSFGRLRPAGLNALLYGFGMQAGLGVSVWMFCRLGRNRLQGGGLVTAGGALWNVGVTFAVVAILSGNSTGYEFLEMPGYVALWMALSYVLMAGWALVTLHQREERGLYVSQWFLLAAILVFPWILSVGELMLVAAPVRGVMQAVVTIWYGHNLLWVCLGGFALAILFYFIPKLTGEPLHSAQVASVTFWTFLLFGSWAGFSPGLPLPNWITGMSNAAGLMLIIPVVGVAMNLLQTWRGKFSALKGDYVLDFMLFALAAFLLSHLLLILNSTYAVAEVTEFTIFNLGVTALQLFGFVGAAVAGAVYYIVPRVLACQWPSSKLIYLHLILGGVGLGAVAVALLAGGLFHGAAANSAGVPYTDVARLTVPFFAVSTIGWILVLAGNVLFLVNLSQVLTHRCLNECLPLARFASAEERQPAGDRV